MNGRKVIVAEPHGFCAGVQRAIDAIETALRRYRPPIYCLHEVVHNRQVVEDLSAKGVCFVEDVDDVPENSILLFSAHGVSPVVRQAAERKGLKVIDATCPFVSRVHEEVLRYAAAGSTVLVIGDGSHDEVVGMVGEAPESVVVVENEEDARRAEVRDPDRVGVVCQTTLSPECADKIIGILRSRFPRVSASNTRDICYATRNRQRAVQALAEFADLILVLGSPNSANTRRLVEVSGSAGCRALMISDLKALEGVSLEGVRVLGLTSGASTPETFLHGALERIRASGFDVQK